MFDIGWQELFVIALLALIVVGPQDLPRVIRTISGVIRKAKGMAREFQSGLDEVIREAELDDMRKQIESQGESLKHDIAEGMDKAQLTEEFDFSKETAELEEAVSTDPKTEPAPSSKPAPKSTSETANETEPPAPAAKKPAAKKTAVKKTAAKKTVAKKKQPVAKKAANTAKNG